MIELHPYQQCQFSLFFFLMHFVSFLGLDFPKKYSHYQTESGQKWTAQKVNDRAKVDGLGPS